ncbi:MAG: hypothetical protein OEM91_02915, partial [Hyphomicrobiales bacterium]|nr:hypothetical protein [Hyphomicrobiales bacterium]
VTGKLQREGIVTHLIAHRLEDCSPFLDTLDETGPPKPKRARTDEVDRPPRPDSRAPIPRRANTGSAPPRHPREQAKILFPSRDFH